MHRTYKYKLNPNKKQKQAFLQTLELCRVLYNDCLQQRRWQRISHWEQMRQVTQLRREFPEYQAVYCHILQNVAKKLNRSFENFFRHAGFPRFKGANRYDSFSFGRTGFKIAGRFLQLSKIGNVRIRLSRPLPKGVIKTCTIKRFPSGWFAILVIDVPFNPLPANAKRVGVDLGIARYATLSDGTVFENPRFYQRAQPELRRAQRRMARRVRGSRRRKKAVNLLKLLHESIANQRNDFLHKQTTSLVRQFGTIVVENLNIAGMLRGNLGKEISDASWGTWLRLLVYKAEDAGRRVVAIAPQHTSQTCPCCGCKHKGNRKSQSEFCCLKCGFEANADLVGAINILARMVPSGANVGEYNAERSLRSVTHTGSAGNVASESSCFRATVLQSAVTPTKFAGGS